MAKVDLILKEVLKEIEPSKEDFLAIEKSLKKFINDLKNNIKKERINAEIFIGGSFAKKTLIKKDKYDIDIFLRFDRKYRNKNISNITKKLLRRIKNVSTIHGSRDYFRIKISSGIIFELIPVINVANPKESDNITDLSYFHVKYIEKKIKNKKILNDIKLAKVFCYANSCYGAESYINGFSGYSLELLVYHYRGFLNFIKAITKIKEKEQIGNLPKTQNKILRKEIIDIEKQYRKKKDVLLDLNSAKLNSPIILIDPTYMQRNALAALSRETFEKFRAICIRFLKKPDREFFMAQGLDLEEVKKKAGKNKYEFILLDASTNKQEGDVAGSKLLKFYRHLDSEISRFFEIKRKGFEYKEGKDARYFFVAKKRKEAIISGPETKDKDNIKKFKSRHKNVFIKNNKFYAREKITLGLKEFLHSWIAKNENKIREMYIKELKIV